MRLIRVMRLIGCIPVPPINRITRIHRAVSASESSLAPCASAARGFAWSFEQQAIAAGIDAPQPVPIPSDGTCRAWVRHQNHWSPASRPPSRPGRIPAQAAAAARISL
jgi:hypothetical protein